MIEKRRTADRHLAASAVIGQSCAVGDSEAATWIRLTERAIASSARPAAVIICPDCGRKVGRAVIINGEAVFVGRLRVESGFESVALVLGGEIPSDELDKLQALWARNRLPNRALASCQPCGQELTIDRAFVKIMAEADDRRGSRLKAHRLLPWDYRP